ncbi:hypothetical protein BDZ89DRAFT_1054296, partial [Hymenopellis radicata]
PGLEKSLDELSPWREDEIKMYPFTWKNPVTGDLHLMVHGWAIPVDPLPPTPRRTTCSILMVAISWTSRRCGVLIFQLYTRTHCRRYSGITAGVLHTVGWICTDTSLGPSEENVRADEGIKDGLQLVEMPVGSRERSSYLDFGGGGNSSPDCQRKTWSSSQEGRRLCHQDENQWIKNKQSNACGLRIVYRHSIMSGHTYGSRRRRLHAVLSAHPGITVVVWCPFGGYERQQRGFSTADSFIVV